VRDANRIIVMERGQIAEQGTHAELLKNENGIYRHLYQLQIWSNEEQTRESANMNPLVPFKSEVGYS
jgi:subfamily B ATP-binding cassette protein HlyB/CyaB